MRKSRIIASGAGVLGAVVLTLAQAGCASGWIPTSRVTRVFAPEPVAENPLLVPVDDFEAVWNKTVAELGGYFDVASENRLSRTIVTEPKMSATVLEPWLADTTTIQDRVEATLQTIRRFAIVKVDPAPNGGFLVKVEVHKELEDMVKPDRQMMGRAVFNNEFPVNRIRETVGPVPVAVGWIARGRDANLEQAILSGIRSAFFL
ncbi:hypothetical protein [Planctomyces sp. SH-PL62]|uniref:hypothetical protein n=1 Tax=Planctomyces sp. SH-PL62 TaxID=1636152 RepID=UPI00078ECF90|nr:hypothetical protein [Planctomyces sp. SH-PL62]AMV37463.1 hypothetical protein VT85_08510 [Planctomyces sp. SH-PL62]